jgi:hypothetical protein
MNVKIVKYLAQNGLYAGRDHRRASLECQPKA